MPAKVRLEHISEGYLAIWKGAGMQAAVDGVGERIAAEAGDPWFKYYARPGNFTAMGFVSSTGPTGAYYEQQEAALSRAVHA